MLTLQDINYLSAHLDFFKNLPHSEQQQIKEKSYLVSYKKDDFVSSGHECLGLVNIKEGRLRIFINSEEGKEITLYRLLKYDTCLLSSSCVLDNIDFNISITAERNTKVYVIPSDLYEKINQSNVYVKNFTLDLLSSRFSDVMWVFNQFVSTPMAKRLAGFLLEQSHIDDSLSLNITHEYIANNLGTAREVVTRLLKHFSSDYVISLKRGNIEIKDITALKKLS